MMKSAQQADPHGMHRESIGCISLLMRDSSWHSDDSSLFAHVRTALGIRSCLTAVCVALVNPAGMHHRVPYTIYACICMYAKDQYTCINEYSNIS